MGKRAHGSLLLIILCVLTAAFTSSCGKTAAPFSSSAADSKITSSATSGTRVSKETQKKYEELQDSVNDGHRPGLLDPEEVAMDFASGTLKIKNLSKTYDTIEKKVADDHATITFKKGGNSVLKMELYQPVTKGATGIWVVSSWTDSKTNETHAIE